MPSSTQTANIRPTRCSSSPASSRNASPSRSKLSPSGRPDCPAVRKKRHAVKITPETLPLVPKIRHLAVSVDGKTLALVVEVLDGAKFRNDLWHIAADGSESAREVDLGGRRVSQPAYLADGSLLFCSAPPEPSPEAEARSVYLIPAGGGT